MSSDRDVRVLGVMFERPGPGGFGDLRAVRVYVGDALDELAATDGPISDDQARVDYEARIRTRAARRAGGGGS